MSTSKSSLSDDSCAENLFLSIFDKSVDATLLLEEGVIVDCNPASLAMLGCEHESQLRSRHLWQFSPLSQPDGRSSRQKEEEILAKALVESTSRFEWEFLRQSGETFPVEISLTVVLHSNRPVIHLVWRDIAERKRVEAELQIAQSSYQAIFNISREAIFVIDIESGAIIAANRRACEVHGYCLEEFQSQGLGLIMCEAPPFDLSGAMHYVQKAAQGEPQLFEWLSRSRNGDPLWGEVSLSRVVIDGRERLVSSTHDISERKQHEAMLTRRAEQVERFQAVLVDLAKSEEREFGTALWHITQVVAAALDVGRVSIWFFNVDESEVVCQDLFESASQTHSAGMTLKATDFPCYFQALEEKRAIAATDVFADPVTAEFRDSYMKPLGIAAMLDVPIWRHGRMVGIVCHEHLGHPREWTREEQDFAISVADMVSLALEASERKAAEDALRVSEAHFRTLFEQFPFSIQILSPEGQTVEVNRAWEELFGMQLSDISEFDLLSDPQLQQQGVLSLLRRGFAGEATAIPETFYDPALNAPTKAVPPRPPFWVQSFVFPVKDATGRIKEVILTHQDITERKQAEAALHEAHQDLQLAHEELERRVAARTRELADANAALTLENAERLRAEAELRHKTSELEAIFEASPDLYFQLDAGGHIFSYHAAQSSDLYAPPEVFLGRRVQDVLPPHVGQKLEQGLTEVAASGTALCLEYDLPLEGKTGNFEARLMPLLDERIIAIVRNITGRKEGEAALRRSEAYFRSLIENALDIITILDANGVIRYESPSIERILGSTPQDLIGINVFELVHPDDLAAMMTLWKPIIEQPGTTHAGEFRYLHRDGSWRVLECICTTLSPSSVDAGIVVNARDVTERKNSEGTLRQSEALKASILEAALDAIITIDHEGRVVEFNPVAEQLFGFERAAVVGLDMATLIIPPEFRNAHMHGVQRYLTTGEGPVLNARIEVRGMRADGTSFPMELAVRPILTLGQPMFTSYIRDISERKAGEEALRQAKEDAEVARETAEAANRAKSEFLSRMSHELRTPMNSILGFAQVLTRKVEPNQRKSVDHILKAGRHLLNLINEVLDIARIEANKINISSEPVRVSHVVQETLNLIQPLAAQRNCIIEDSISGLEDFYVLADRQRLTQVLLNIVSNAVKYNREAGAVRLSWEQLEGARLRIAISDDGPGLTPEQMERIFNPFDRLGAEQSDIEGTGLGLALSKGLVEVMGGALGVKSVLGQGCTFWVEFALIESPQQRLARTREGATLPETLVGCQRSTVLYIEDNLANFSLIEEILTDHHEITLYSALQGRTGLELAWTHRPDVILLDLHLPDMTGDEVLARLRTDVRSRELPVIVISADATGSHIKDMLNAGAQAYLTKPLDIDEFLATLNTLLEAKEN